jgi:hypothetical protein
MSDFIAPTLINWLIENLESAQDIEYVDLTEINNKPIYQCWGDKITHILLSIRITMDGSAERFYP